MEGKSFSCAAGIWHRSSDPFCQLRRARGPVDVRARVALGVGRKKFFNDEMVNFCVKNCGEFDKLVSLKNLRWVGSCCRGHYTKIPCCQVIENMIPYCCFLGG